MNEATSSTSNSATTTTTTTPNTITPATSIDSVPTTPRSHHYQHPTRSLSLKVTKDVSLHISLPSKSERPRRHVHVLNTRVVVAYFFFHLPTETIFSCSFPFSTSNPRYLRAGNKSSLSCYMCFQPHLKHNQENSHHFNTIGYANHRGLLHRTMFTSTLKDETNGVRPTSRKSENRVRPSSSLFLHTRLTRDLFALKAIQLLPWSFSLPF